MLLNLPPELIQLVFQHASTTAYLQASYACRTLYEIASTCREAVLHHLHQTPGLNSNIESIDTRQLFRLLMKRASKQLLGAQFRANCKNFCFESQTIDVRASSLAPSANLDLALVVRDQPHVYVSRVNSEGLSFTGRLKLPWDHPGESEVLKTAFDNEGDVYILQRFTPIIDDGTDVEHPFVKHALQSSPKGMVYLVHYELGHPGGRIRMCAFPEHDEYKPLAFTVANKDAFAISWQHARDSNEYEVVIYRSLEESSDDASDIIELSYDSAVVLDGSGDNLERGASLQSRLTSDRLASQQGPVTDLTFNDRSSQLLYYYRAQTLYGSFQRIDSPSFPLQPKIHENSCTVQFSDSLNLLFSIGIPFFGTHETCVQNGRQMCHWQYLALGIATHRRENWTVACLLKSEAFCRTHHCGHILNLDRGRRFSDWKVAARLWGFQEPTNSLGSIVATSHRGTRIAVANWSVLYIWAIDPDVLIKENAGGFYPPSSTSPNSGMIELRPIVLQVDAVCFKLRFMENEDQLLAITDRGVMHWDLGALSKGQRTVHRLAI